MIGNTPETFFGLRLWYGQNIEEKSGYTDQLKVLKTRLCSKLKGGFSLTGTMCVNIITTADVGQMKIAFYRR